ncbi:MAG TPA: hypothetical protein VLI42_03565, partial [Chthoniobacterales bacterium]|nr:hypothetical protein [Chthoniobacterales bacterium]
AIENLLRAHSYGGTLSARWQATDWWQLDGSISLLQLTIDQAGSHDPTGGAGEANDPDVSFILHSRLDLARNVEFDSYLRFVDDLPNPATPSYLELDLRVGWSPRPGLEVAIVGRNLLDEAHPEFAGTMLTREVRRSLYGTLRWEF